MDIWTSSKEGERQEHKERLTNMFIQPIIIMNSINLQWLQPWNTRQSQNMKSHDTRIQKRKLHNIKRHFTLLEAILHRGGSGSRILRIRKPSSLNITPPILTLEKQGNLVWFSMILNHHINKCYWKNLDCNFTVSDT